MRVKVAQRPRVLLWNKASLLELLERKGGEGIFGGLGMEDALQKIRASHEETVRSRQLVREVLEELGCFVKEPSRLRVVPMEAFDLVVVVGGDGTVLDVARFIDGTPILAVNSSPTTSVGHFCRTTADGFREVLKRVLKGAEEPKTLTRIAVEVDGKGYRFPALNDVLVAHKVPAATSRYVIRVGEEAEEQKSSGVWVATAAGSSGAILSAGGEAMDIRDRRLQFLVREPFFHSTPGARQYRLLRGFVGEEGIEFISRMMEGGLYLDGRRIAIPFRYGSRARLSPNGPVLKIYLRDRV